MELTTIWNEYESAVRAFLHSKVSSPEDVEDLSQEILIKIQNNINNIRSESGIKPWLFQVTNNIIVDFYRKRARQKDLSVDDLWYERDDPEFRQEMLSCIEPFINALPEDERELLRKVDIEGVSQKMIASEMGISYSTLKSRVQKSRVKLRELFEGCCHFTKNNRGDVIDCERK
ncbi:RNA polymerase sigma factor SigZ [Aliikangiella coralliicola]|uniref:RNA polymerase sigma factor SigZ n=1 Tax=Aliikangiella coralliicola TaxID=2592383 RepID=A0A545UDT3_9GAMM|nr:RNA polymerase sigma factor SigZ [Aliikangiella coralliicola]TQV87630.1 RNA polymerase sigma factor SigZ [Aliikangiella coralliicola]